MKFITTEILEFKPISRDCNRQIINLEAILYIEIEDAVISHSAHAKSYPACLHFYIRDREEGLGFIWLYDSQTQCEKAFKEISDIIFEYESGN